MHDIYLSLGSNQGDSQSNLQTAVDLIFERVGSITQISPVYKTASWGYAGADFLNAVIGIKTDMESTEVLREILLIEDEIGRKRQLLSTGKKYEDRIIDIDILFFADTISNNPDLKIPHPEMERRRFVLQPLCDIAPKAAHPKSKKSIELLLRETEDQNLVQKLDVTLSNPLNKFGFAPYQYIAIEGNIGAGKTTLASMIARDFNAKLILERFKDNPFLPQFYKDKTRYAFALEMSFLADRYQQLLDDLGQHDLFKDFMISDYDSHKSLIFAQITLNNDEFALYKKLHGIMYREIVKPGLYVYLYQNTERLLDNIKKRGRAYEQDISQEYLTQIGAGYLKYIKTKREGNVKIIDVTALDFVNNRRDYVKVLSQMAKIISKN